MFKIYRTTLSHEAVSSTSDPILPSQYDLALLRGTVYLALDLYHRDANTKALIADFYTLYGVELSKARVLRMKQRFVGTQQYGRTQIG